MKGSNTQIHYITFRFCEFPINKKKKTVKYPKNFIYLKKFKKATVSGSLLPNAIHLCRKELEYYLIESFGCFQIRSVPDPFQLHQMRSQQFRQRSCLIRLNNEILITGDNKSGRISLRN